MTTTPETGAADRALLVLKERPILFSAPMVRALLDGSKTQTRRIVKPHPRDDAFCLVDHGDGWWPYRSEDGESPNIDNMEYPFSCPYGQPGDRLWVRESYRFLDSFDAYSPARVGDRCLDAGYSKPWAPIHYEADGARRDWMQVGTPPAGAPTPGKGRPSIHMPRWASRILLEIVSVRVERLNDCSESDAVSEGCTKNHNGYYWGGPHTVSGTKQMATARQAYRDPWESINGAGSWGVNPWVWCVEFKRAAAIGEVL